MVSQIVSEGLMRIAEVEKFLGVSRSMVYKLMESGRLPWVQLGRARRIPRDAVHRLAAELLRGGDSPGSQGQGGA